LLIAANYEANPMVTSAESGTKLSSAMEYCLLLCATQAATAFGFAWVPASAPKMKQVTLH
jgi:hypothetical protein